MELPVNAEKTEIPATEGIIEIAETTNFGILRFCAFSRCLWTGWLRSKMGHFQLQKRVLLGVGRSASQNRKHKTSHWRRDGFEAENFFCKIARAGWISAEGLKTEPPKNWENHGPTLVKSPLDSKTLGHWLLGSNLVKSKM